MSRSPHIPHDAPLVLDSSISLLEQYDALIQQMRDRIDELQANRARIQIKINAYGSIQAPVRRIPAELLCLIFQYFAQYEGGCDGLSVTGLLRVSAVCSIWRNIFIGLPRLWSNIIVDEKDWPRDNRKKGRRLLDALRLSLERSTAHPLTLTLSFPDILLNEVMPNDGNGLLWIRLADQALRFHPTSG
ncbi:hypothetical protein FB45DRAFT_745349 [Roridomyces roridus]|uniref:F-box domain-containing protein n=1 Tax=Roridomyces roridus TaxID=1738132 RepID=A0AAD7FRI6_9AGAR|nr:hypothetical protein FB45DRAFT_745349 [Roridomyces roridus]